MPCRSPLVRLYGSIPVAAELQRLTQGRFEQRIAADTNVDQRGCCRRRTFASCHLTAATEDQATNCVGPRNRWWFIEVHRERVEGPSCCLKRGSRQTAYPCSISSADRAVHHLLKRLESDEASTLRWFFMEQPSPREAGEAMF